MVDAGGSGQDEADLELYAAQILAADPQKNVLFAYHAYGSVNAYSDSVASINGAVITLASTAATHPFMPGYNGAGNNWCPITAWDVGGKVYASGSNAVGGSPGKWTVTLSAAPAAGAVTAGMVVADNTGNLSLKFARLAALASQGICVTIAEFGPGLNIGPSPTMVTPQQIIAAAEVNNLGWLAWAFDDGAATGNTTASGSFSLTVNAGTYTGATTELTTYGQVVIPLIQQLAQPATM
jgi:hypothetical protein